MGPQKCPDCSAEMKPLFTSFFCPNDCDTPEGKQRNIEKAEAKLRAARPFVWVNHSWDLAALAAGFRSPPEV